MGLETATYVGDLVNTNPGGTDPKSQGDDHFRLTKSALQNTFPNATKAFRFPNTKASQATSFSITTDDQNAWYPVDASGGSITVTLPLGSGVDDGFAVEILRTDSNISAASVTVATAGSDTINGQSNRVLFGQFEAVRLIWFADASAWYAPIIDGVDIGTPVLWFLNTVPSPAYLMTTGPNRQATAASVDYPALFDLFGTTFGGDATDFGLPQPAGYGVRLLDETGVVDVDGVGRAVGSTQDHAFRRHNHPHALTLPNHAHGAQGGQLFATTPAQAVGLTAPTGSFGFSGQQAATGNPTSLPTIGGTISNSNTNDSINETRMKNMAFNLMIKAR